MATASNYLPAGQAAGDRTGALGQSREAAADLELFVSDQSRQRAERSAFQLDNTLLVGEPGSGKTSLLYKIRGNASSLHTNLPGAIFVDARLAQTPEVLVALIDDPSPEQAAVLFGQLRDELWQLPLWFTAAVRPAVETEVLSRPPADAFFDARIELELFAPEAAVEMLRRRATPGAQIVTPNQPLQNRLIELGQATAGRAGGMRVAEIWNHGAVSASDNDLQRSIGLSRPRLTQLLTALESEGILHSFREPASGTIGRPKTLYDINRNR